MYNSKLAIVGPTIASFYLYIVFGTLHRTLLMVYRRADNLLLGTLVVTVKKILLYLFFVDPIVKRQIYQFYNCKLAIVGPTILTFNLYSVFRRMII